VTGPASGDSPLTSPEAILQACRDAVAAAVATNSDQQASAGRWMTASEPEAPAAYPVAAAPTPSRRRRCRDRGVLLQFPSRERRRR